MDGPREHYREGKAAAEAEATALEERARRVSRLRIFAFLAMAGPLLLIETSPREIWPLLVGLGVVGGGVFVLLIRRHRRLRRDLSRARLRATLNQEALARLRRDWDHLPSPPLEGADRDHPSAGDLDLVGRASLSHLLGRVSTIPGRALLRQILLDPFAPLPVDGVELLERIRAAPTPPEPGPGPGWADAREERQEAVRILAGTPVHREWIELLAREIERAGASPKTADFLTWLEQPRWLERHGRLLLAARALALYTPVTLVTWLLGWTPGVLPVLGALCALALHRSVAPEIRPRFEAAEAGEGDLAGWSALLAHAEDTPTGSRLLDRIRQSVRQPDPGAAQSIRALRRLTDTASIRRSSLAHFPLVTLFAWDLHVLDRLERWHTRHAEVAGRWVRATGELEVLCALGGLLFDHPDWRFPTFSEDPEEGLRAFGLGHPILDPESCVPNDIEIPPPGNLLLVTGSNMAGKTTLLRAIGVNQVLALAGGPVAATEFRTRPLLPWTCMRVRDSLEGGVSYFLAELQRLKRVVDAARGGSTLYLLDEILQGTNSEERRTAARIVLAQLLETPAVGAITTHDLTLASTESLQKHSTPVHFREEVIEVNGLRELNFDYKLRPGPATSRNALLLLELVGLNPPDPPG